ncbi:MAG: alpha/beta hydrolase [Actinomycetaceae bacterium]
MTFHTGPLALPTALPQQEMDPRLARFLRTAAAAGRRPASELGPAAARAQIEAASARAPRGPGMARVLEAHAAGPGGRVPLRIYEPEEVRGTIVYAHGGGWTTGSIAAFDGVTRHLAAATRCRVVSVEYRLAPEHPFPAAFEDAHAALAWSAWQYGHGPLILAGDSAGGNLAAVVAAQHRDRSLPLAGQILIYPVIDSDQTRPSYAEISEGDHLLTGPEMSWYWDQYVPNPADRLDPRVAPLREKDLTGSAPAIVVLAGHDPLRDEVREYVHRLRDAGTPVSFHEYPTMGHGFINYIGVVESANRLFADISRDLDELLGDEPAGATSRMVAGAAMA